MQKNAIFSKTKQFRAVVSIDDLYEVVRRRYESCRSLKLKLHFKTQKIKYGKVAPFFDAEYLINGTTYRHSFNEILTVTYTRPAQQLQCHFE